MKRLCFIALLLVVLAFPSDVRADVAPPIFPPGSNPQPGAEMTQVRMVAETVVIEIQKDIAPQSLGQARVTADFTMHNTGAANESMAARFPISGNNGRGEYPEIDNLQVWVNGKQVQYRRATYPDVGFSDDEVPWAEFDITFPAGQDVSIRVVYGLKGSGYYPYTAFYYILETGAGWKDTIGSADVILRLPYEASLQNVILDVGLGWANTTPSGVFEGNEVRWHFDEFEPGKNGPVRNMEFALVAPSAWETVLNARANTEKYPNDGEAWGMLAKAYKQIFVMSKGYREDSGGRELYELGVEAYEKCLSLKPNDAQWHAGFAELLANRAMWDSWMSDPAPETYRALEEIHTALKLAPNDPVVKDIALSISYMLPGGITQNGADWDFPWLTATPTKLPPTPTEILIEEPTVTPFSLPAVTDTPQSEPTQMMPIQTDLTETSETPTPQESTPFCGSAVLLPLIAMFWFTWKRS
jgi:tetratricopeptide (TPR) repeat protein